jgi:uncharacterized membrane-anchored protein
MNLRLFIYVPLALIQLAVPGWMIFQQEQVLKHGRVFKFQTAPVDPYDAFRGRYVALSFAAERTGNTGNFDYSSRQKLWVQIAADEKGFAKVARVSTEPLAGDDVLIATSRWGGLHFPFDRYYMDEKSAPEAETAYRANSRREHENAYATVRILNGRSALEELYIDDKPVREFLQTEAKK